MYRYVASILRPLNEWEWKWYGQNRDFKKEDTLLVFFPLLVLNYVLVWKYKKHGDEQREADLEYPPPSPNLSWILHHGKAHQGLGGGWFLKVDDFHLFLNLNERVGYSLTTRGRWGWSLRSLIKAQGTGKSLTRDEWNTLLPHAHSHGMGIDQSSLSVLVQGILSTSATSTSSSAVSECSQPCEAAPKLKKSPHWCAWSRM